MQHTTKETPFHFRNTLFVRSALRSSHEYNGVLYISLLQSAAAAIWSLDAAAAAAAAAAKSGSGCDGCLPLSNMIRRQNIIHNLMHDLIIKSLNS